MTKTLAGLFRPIVLLAALIGFPLCPVQAQSPDAGFSGTWRIDLPKPGGVPLHTFFVLHLDGKQLTGSVYPNNAVEIPIADVHWDGPTAVFHIDWHWTFHLTPDGDRLAVVVSYDGGGQDSALAVRVPETDVRVAPGAPLPDLPPLPDNGLARTPPMGWNSWNHFAEGVNDKVVRETADALVRSGMAKAGYVYVNIDDTWEGSRDAQGNIVPNGKFPDMKALGAYLHSKGLKFGIYSSPGFVTCGGYEGSYGHELQDAKTYASWGVDYLKYDWCSAARVYTDAQLQPVYRKMGDALEHSGRAIVYSLCEYGTGDVWKWAPEVSGNVWRTTGDIQDNWDSMCRNGFDQGRLAPYARPGHWNDPDMLEVGNGGMTATEYRTHFSLWCILASPLIAGNDIRTMSEETRQILTNREVIAIDQDAQGSQGTRSFAKDGVEVWTKPLKGGAVAVGIFNRNAAPSAVSFTWDQVGRSSKPAKVRDLWAHQNLAPAGSGFQGNVAGHGVLLLRVN